METIADYVASALSMRADPEAAEAMAAYMKTEMPFYGVKATERRRIQREAVRRYPARDRSMYQDQVIELWARPHREEKYVAVGVARAYPDHITMQSVPLYRRLITEGAWWDFVDEIAAHLIGTVLGSQRAEMAPILDDWIDDPDMWLRRTAILAQLGHKDATDTDMLFRYCLTRAHEKEFFIRKAIGWSLREYAKTDPDAVRRFVLDRRSAWSGLTFREATKHLDLA